MQWTAVADEWGTAMIELDGRTPHLVEFDLHFDDGGWRNDGVRYENDEVLHPLRHRRMQAEEAVVFIHVDSEATAGDLLPLILACQRTAVEFTLTIPGNTEDRKQRKAHWAAAHSIRWATPSEMIKLCMPNIAVTVHWHHAWFPGIFQMSAPLPLQGTAFSRSQQ